MRLSLIVLSLFFCHYAIGFDIGEQGIQLKLKRSFIVVHRLEIVFPEGYAAIAQKMSLALNERKEWFGQYISDHQKEKVLPYHPDFGISEDEYKRWLELGDRKELKEVGKDKGCVISNRPTGEIAILGIFKQSLVIKPDGKSGRLGIEDFRGDYVKIDSERSIVGPWAGFKLTFDETVKNSPEMRKNYHVSILKPQEGTFKGRIIFKGSLATTVDGKIVESEEVHWVMAKDEAPVPE